MITRRFIPRGWYAAARPGGAFVALVTGQYLVTRDRTITLPKDQNLLFVDLAPDGIHVAGTGGKDDRAWLWGGYTWADQGGAYGAHAVLFTPAGELLVNHNHALPTGLRQFADDGTTVISCEQTYADQKRRLYEFTTRGGLTIGQGGDGPDGGDPLVAILPDGTARLLQKGTCRAIRFYRDGDELAIAWWQEDQRGAGLLWATVQDLEALPVYQRPVPIPAIGRPCWLGWFEFAPPTTPCPGNSSLNVYWQDGDGILRDRNGLSVAQFVEGEPEGDLEAINRAIAAAKPLGLPVVAYWPRVLQAGPFPPGCIVGVEAYRGLAETQGEFEARVVAAVKRCPKAALICQAYTSNVAQTTDLASLVPIYARIAKAQPNVWGLLAFSGSGRATGLQDHPEIRPLWAALAAGIPAAPPIETEEFMEPWKVTVTKYDETIARGARAIFRAKLGNGVEVEWQKEADDTVHLAVFQDGKQRDRSSSGRHVDIRG